MGELINMQQWQIEREALLLEKRRKKIEESIKRMRAFLEGLKQRG